MKVWNEKRQFFERAFLFTVFAWDKDIEISLDAWEYESGGQSFYDKYTSKDVIKAIKKAVELSEAGWEEVCLSFRPVKSDNERIASFEFRIKDGVQAIFSVNKEIWMEKCGKKLAEIKRIIEEEEVDAP